MRRFQTLVILAGMLAAPAAAVATPDQPGADATAEQLDWSTRKPRLGVMLIELTPELRTFYGSVDQTGVLVARVEPGSPAALAGIVVGDVITSVQGTKVDDVADIVMELDRTKSRVSVKLLRDHKAMTLNVDLERSPSSVLQLPGLNWLRDLFATADRPSST